MFIHSDICREIAKFIPDYVDYIRFLHGIGIYNSINKECNLRVRIKCPHVDPKTRIYSSNIIVGISSLCNKCESLNTRPQFTVFPLFYVAVPKCKITIKYPKEPLNIQVECVDKSITIEQKKLKHRQILSPEYEMGHRRYKRQLRHNNNNKYLDIERGKKQIYVDM